jgi:hypothetical protein
MFDTLDNALPYITAGLFALALLLLAVSVRLFRRSRTDVYWRKRRDAGRRGLRLFMTAVLLFLASGVACLMTVLAIMIKDDQPNDATPVVDMDTASPTWPASEAAVHTTDAPQTEATTAVPDASTADNNTAATNDLPTATTTPVNSLTPVPSVVVVITASPANTPTQTPFPTFTPNATPLVSSVTPNPRASLEITALDDRVSDTAGPVDPRTTFAAGTDRIYLFVDYRNMDEGVLWQRLLYYENEQIDGSAYLWGQDRDGTGYFFFGRDNGFEPGNYEIRLLIGEQTEPVSTAAFRVLPAP